MKISKFFIRVKSAVYAQCAIRKYRRRLRRMTDDELKVIIARERVCKGWTSERSYYLAALCYECKVRRLAYCWE